MAAWWLSIPTEGLTSSPWIYKTQRLGTQIIRLDEIQANNLWWYSSVVSSCERAAAESILEKWIFMWNMILSVTN